MPRKAQKKEAAKPIVIPNNTKRSSSDLHAVVREKVAKIIELRRKDEQWDEERYDEEFQAILSRYAPNFAFSSLYIRLGRQFRRHYNSETISVVRTLSQQLDVTVLDLLKKLRFYFVAKPSRQFDKETCTGGLAPYGFRIMFAMRRTLKDGKDPCLACPDELKEAIVGLNLTCSMLESLIVDNASVTFTNLGRKEESKKEQIRFVGDMKPTPTKLSVDIVRPKRASLDTPSDEAEANKRQKKAHLVSKPPEESETIGLSQPPPALKQHLDTIFGTSETNDDTDELASHLPNNEATNDNEKDAQEQLDIIFGKKSGDTNDTTDNTNSVDNNTTDNTNRVNNNTTDNTNSVDNFTHQSKALIRTHLISTFGKRLWSQVEHRLLALEVVEYIMKTALSHHGQVGVNENEFLKLSFQITSGDEERDEFIDCLTDYCLAYKNRQDIIADADWLVGTLWAKKQDRVFNVANEWEKHIAHLRDSSHEAMVIAMDEPFDKLRDLKKGKTFSDADTGRSTVENETNWWNVIRARIFCLFLDFAGNKAIKDKLKKYKNPTGAQAPPRKSRKRKKKKTNGSYIP